MNLDNLSQKELIDFIKKSQQETRKIREELDAIKKELNHNPTLSFDASTIPFEQKKTLDECSKVSGGFLTNN
jgi:hypothetical protein